MRVSALQYLAWKIFKGKKQSGLASFLTWMGILGVCISTASFLLVQTVMYGFSDEIQEKVLGFNSHFRGTSEKEVSQEVLDRFKRRYPQVKVMQYQQSEALIQSTGSEPVQIGVQVRAMLQEDLVKMSPMILEHYYHSQAKDFEEGDEFPGLYLGKFLTEDLLIIPEIPEDLDLMFPFGDLDPSGNLIPNLKRFRVIGYFETGYPDFDESYVIISRKQSKGFFNESIPFEVAFWIPDPFATKLWEKRIQDEFAFASLKTWQDENAKLFSALKMEKMGMRIVLCMMLLFASFNILSMLMLFVMEYFKDIAILKTLGLSSKDISVLFSKVGFLIGAIGSFLGLILGTCLLVLLKSKAISLPALYDIQNVPLSWNVTLFIYAVLLGPILSMMAAYFPAKKAARISVVEALRYE